MWYISDGAPVAQRKERHLSSVLVAGSSPAGGANSQSIGTDIRFEGLDKSLVRVDNGGELRCRALSSLGQNHTTKSQRGEGNPLAFLHLPLPIALDNGSRIVARRPR